jgi:hypothetical protein
MDFSEHYVARAQRWHATDHGKDRGKPIRGTRFVKPRADDVPPGVPEDFRDCALCNPDGDGTLAAHTNPYWYRVVAWES